MALVGDGVVDLERLRFWWILAAELQFRKKCNCCPFGSGFKAHRGTGQSSHPTFLTFVGFWFLLFSPPRW